MTQIVHVIFKVETSDRDEANEAVVDCLAEITPEKESLLSDQPYILKIEEE